MPAAVHAREPLLERRDFLPVQSTPFAAAQNPEQPFFFFFAKDRPLRKRARPDRLAAEERESFGRRHALVLLKFPAHVNDSVIAGADADDLVKAELFVKRLRGKIHSADAEMRAR
jgi:hypothetical protein